MRKQTLLGVFLLTFCAVADGTKPVPPTASAGAVDCVKNGSFEMRGAAGEKCWRLSEGWSIGRGFGRNGSGGLVFESKLKSGKVEKLKSGKVGENSSSSRTNSNSNLSTFQPFNFRRADR